MPSASAFLQMADVNPEACVYDELRRDLDDLGVLNEYRDRRLILKVTHLLTR